MIITLWRMSSAVSLNFTFQSVHLFGLDLLIIFCTSWDHAKEVEQAHFRLIMFLCQVYFIRRTHNLISMICKVLCLVRHDGVLNLIYMSPKNNAIGHRHGPMIPHDFNQVSLWMTRFLARHATQKPGNIQGAAGHPQYSLRVAFTVHPSPSSQLVSALDVL